MAFIDSGRLEASDKFRDVDKSKWRALAAEKRDFLAVQISYDCRCLVEFCEEASFAWKELGYESAEDMIQRGYELDPVEIGVAVAWLKHNDPQVEIGIRDIVPLRDVGRPTKEESGNVDATNILNVNNGSKYWLRRIARDCPGELDAIESGEKTVIQVRKEQGWTPNSKRVSLTGNPDEDRKRLIDAFGDAYIKEIANAF